MAQHLKSITHGKTTWHLSTNGRDIFQSRHYFTGGVLFPEVKCRNGCIADRHTRASLSDRELIALLGGDEPVTSPFWETVIELLDETLAPFLHRRREVRLNPLLG